MHDQTKSAARAAIDRAADRLLALSHRLHAHPELGFEEVRASAWLGEELTAHGFRVEAGVCDLPTAFVATAGSGPLVIGICAEYDALPGIGHACGHNVIAGAAVAAGIGLAEVADEIGVTVKVIGTPAEENGGGKVLMIERGAFEGLDAAMMVHPAPRERLDPPVLARAQLHIEYEGRPAHASACPEDGINAADALTVAQVAIGLLRQHVPGDQRIHGIVTEGGQVPNIVPAHTSADYYVRAPALDELAVLEKRVRACFEAGAIATGSRLTITSASPAYSHFRHDAPLLDHYRRNALALGRVFPEVTPADDRTAASTDMANVSLVVPSIQPLVSIDSGSVGQHQAEFAEYAVRPAADRALLDGGIAMAWTGIDLARARS
ncbi:amidohydrolase [Thermocatellispora tengchongensis]|uniref:Peptidase M20 domain-containing protein 2 n=1 Tax=Thermocatellispora tengchongensis TaxID=1073253 RepID=A0A840NTT9_9ACTN|nr:M20 family metallopeptidase [Thermocatellispora tengchongensis]MBB5130988.1 amidohydrolase [Thermocatellispora tengchongensis]